MSAFTLNQSVMRHGGSCWAVLASAWIGLLLAGAVYTLEPPSRPTDSAPPMTFLAASEFEAVAFIDDGTNAATAPSEAPARNDAQAAQLFGMETEPVAAGELPAKWHDVEAAMAQDFAVVAQCHANGTCPIAAQRLIDISAEGAGRSGRARVGLINRAADLAISPVSDEMQWGVADHWSDPARAMRLPCICTSRRPSQCSRPRPNGTGDSNANVPALPRLTRWPRSIEPGWRKTGTRKS